MKLVSAIAGLVIAGSGKEFDAQIVTTIHDTLKFARKIDCMYRRTCDDNRSLVHSAVFSCLPPPSAEKEFSLNRVSKRLGIPRTSLQTIFKKLETKRAPALEGVNTTNNSVVFSQVVMRKCWAKIDELLKRIIVKYIVKHPNGVIHSSIMNDTILVKEPTYSSKKIKKNKLLLQTSVRKLHSDLISLMCQSVLHQMGRSLFLTLS